MRFSHSMICAVTLVALLLAGCSPVVEPMQPVEVQKTPLTTRQPEASETPLAQPVPTLAKTLVPQPTLEEEPLNNSGVTPMPDSGDFRDLVVAARDDLAGRLAVRSVQIEVVELSSVTWPDGSLGCPKPGMMYTQSLVDGKLLRFRAAGVIYEYHSGGTRPAFYCEKPAKALPLQNR